MWVNEGGNFAETAGSDFTVHVITVQRGEVFLNICFKTTCVLVIEYFLDYIKSGSISSLI